MMDSESLDKKEVEAIRREYARKKLLEEDVSDNPVEQFAVWFRQALAADLPDANAMTLATASAEGAPSARIVLLKGFDRDGFRFYTNYESRKGQELHENPQAAVCFFWPQLERQIRIEGKVEKLSRKESANYFGQRPRLSQLGAWASSQSREIASRGELEQHFEKMKKRFTDEDVPLPDFWGGYLLKPFRFEFWQGRRSRMHDRLVYKQLGDDWKIVRLAP